MCSREAEEGVNAVERKRGVCELLDEKDSIYMIYDFVMIWDWNQFYYWQFLGITSIC